ncbi:MAG: diguanylate cyclase [Halopseudomonas sp.]|uniref:diguanylate cyclase domain-containing protein n=1 Tax=Halopseudomonas sp. TaxID=2901191 RepID=UPI0030020947
MSPSFHLPQNQLLDLLLDVVCVVDMQGKYIWVSAASERVFGYTPQEMIGRSAFDLMHPDDRAANQALVAQINSGNASLGHENRYLHKDGHIVHIMWSAQLFEAEQLRVGVARDITQRKQAEALQAALYAISEVAHGAENLQTLYRNIHRKLGQLLPAENAFVALYDAAREQLSFPYHVDHFASPPPPRTLKLHVGDADNLDLNAKLNNESMAERLLANLRSVEAASARHWLGVPLISGGKLVGAMVLQSHDDSVSYNTQHKDLLLFVSGQMADAIERKRAHSRLEFLAQYDQLTELPNRALFMDRLQTSLQRARRNTQRVAVLYLDMDNFKQINDTLGHLTGDRLLQEVAQRLNRCIRESDTVGRLGGDEFAIMLDNIGKPDDAIQVAGKIVAALSAPYLLESHSMTSTPSLGVAIYPDDAEQDLQLIQLADSAMYKAKREGGNRYVSASAGRTPGSGHPAPAAE